jgi:hypothetical protein
VSAPPSGDAEATTTAAAANAEDPAIDAGSRVLREMRDPLAAFTTSIPESGRSVGHTSVVFKLKLEAGVDAAYKPRSTIGDGRYRGEIAAFRLSRALGLTNVPPALPRSFPYEALQKAVGGEKVFAQVVKEDDGSVRGAIIPWIKGLELSSVDKDAEMGQWRAWLRAGTTIPDDKKRLASEVATMLAFDMVTGNWDRWSGGNVGVDRARDSLLFIDNDGAFFDPVPVKEMKRPTTLFEGVDRYSRSFVTRLRALDVAAALGEERPGEPLLSARVTEACDARRKRVLAVIDAKIAKLGEDAVLAFE